MSYRIITGAALGLALVTSAQAQSYNAPAGIPAATAPGGLEGIAASGNVARYGQRFVGAGPITVESYTTGSVRPSQGERRR